MGSKAGVIKGAANKAGVTLAEYIDRRNAGQKWCYRCDCWKPIDSFGMDKTRSDGHAAACKACRYQRTMPGPSKEERRQKKHEGLAWCRMCKDWLPIDKIKRGICQVHANEMYRIRYATDRLFRLEVQQRTMARTRHVLPIPVEAQIDILEDFDGKCAYCENEATTWDHIVPISKGGNSTPGNIVPACISCNSSKKGRDVAEWIFENNKAVKDEFLGRIALADAGFYG